MGLIRVEEVDNCTEELIIAGMITSSSFLSYLSDRLNLQYFRNTQCKLVADLIQEFFEIHKKAPEGSIRELFESIVDHISKEDAAITDHLLSNISKKYSGREISFEVLKDTTDEYFEVRAVELLSEKLSGLVARGKTEESISTIDTWYKDPKRNIIHIISPFDRSMAEAVMTADERLYKFNNDLDYVFPPQVSNKLYTFLGGTKSGKSQWLGHLGVSFAEAGLKVVIWQFELTYKEFMGRILSNITGKQLDKWCKDNTKDEELPVFDCQLNRERSCELPECPDNPDDVDFSTYEEDKWTPCSYCRGLPEFKPVVWKIPYKVGVINSTQELRKEQLMWERQFGDNIRIICADPGTLSVEDAKNQLERLRLTEGFVPHVVIFDQADNLKPSSKYNEKRHEIGGIWLELSGLSKKGYLVWTASQTNRGGWFKEWIETSDVGEDASKLMVCNGVITINQYIDPAFNEHMWQTQRLRAFYFRGSKMPMYDVRTLNDFSRSNPCLDVEKMRRV